MAVIVTPPTSLGPPSSLQRGDKDQYDFECWRLYSEGLNVNAIAQQLQAPPRSVRNAIARVKARIVEPETRELIRQWGIVRLEELVEQAEKAGNLQEARRATMDVMKIAGVVSTGGNVVNFQMGQASTDQLEKRVDAWLEAQVVLEGEVAEDEEDELRLDGINHEPDDEGQAELGD